MSDRIQETKGRYYRLLSTRCIKTYYIDPTLVNWHNACCVASDINKKGNTTNRMGKTRYERGKKILGRRGKKNKNKISSSTYVQRQSFRVLLKNTINIEDEVAIFLTCTYKRNLKVLLTFSSWDRHWYTGWGSWWKLMKSSFVLEVLRKEQTHLISTECKQVQSQTLCDWFIMPRK
jgi:hypothetical protein